jgi:hypothetical protein
VPVASSCQALGISALAQIPSPLVTDPFALQRILVPSNRISRELQRLDQGHLVQLSRQEFEAKVRRAALAAASLKRPPHLVQARYHGSLEGTALTGEAQWSVENCSASTVILPVTPLDLALRDVRSHGEPTALGDLAGNGTPAVSIGRAALELISFQWSSAGDLTPGGVRFELRIPQCPLTSFNLDLPADRVPSLLDRDVGLVSGPEPSSKAIHQLWRLQCGGRSQIDLLIRSGAQGTNPSPLVLAQLQTRVEVYPDRVAADYEFRNLQVLHGELRELRCQCDSGLRPIRVSLANSDTDDWQLQPSSTAGGPSTLVIHLSEPLRGRGLPVHIHCVASAPNGEWRCPALRLMDALPLSEMISLRLAAGLTLNDWHSGDFELVGGNSSATGSQVLTLRSNSAGTDGNARRPRAHLEPQPVRYQVHQKNWWQITSTDIQLLAQFTVEVSAGRLFRLPFSLPAGWQVERVRSYPPNRFESWSVVAGTSSESPVLLIDCPSPIESSRAVQIYVELKPVAGAALLKQLHTSTSPVSLQLPSIMLPDLVLNEGVLAISVDPRFQATVDSPEQPTTVQRSFTGVTDDRTAWAGVEVPGSPFGRQVPDYVFPFRGRNLVGSLHLRAQQPRFRARSVSEVVIGSGRGAMLIRLDLEPIMGSIDTVHLHLSTTDTSLESWKTTSATNGVKAVERLWGLEVTPYLLALSSGTPLTVPALLKWSLTEGSHWNLTLRQPLHEPLHLETTVELSRLDAAANSQRWPIPLLSVAGAAPMEGEVRLRLFGGNQVGTDAYSGLHKPAPRSQPGTSAGWQVFEYAQPPHTLFLSARSLQADTSPPALADHAELRTEVHSDGQVIQCLAFQIRNWTQSSLPLRLPLDAEPLAVKAHGRWSAPLASSAEPSQAQVLQLPVAANAATQLFEVRYRMQRKLGRIWTRLRAPLPELPVQFSEIRHIWRLPHSMLPLLQSRWRRLDNGSGLASEWQSVAGYSDDADMLLLHPDVFSATSWAISILFMLGAWQIRLALSKRHALICGLAIGTCLFAHLWVPKTVYDLLYGPILSTLVLAAAACLWPGVSRETPVLRPGLAAGTVVFSLLIPSAVGNTSSPFTVWIIEGGKDRVEQRVLAPRELLEKLGALSHDIRQFSQRATLVSAHYDGIVGDDRVTYTAEFQVHSLADGPVVAYIPLAGIELTSATLDNVPAYPQALPPPQSGYSVQVPRRGIHNLRLRFMVPIQSRTPEQSVRFQVPEVLQSSLQLALPAGATHAKCIGARGLQETTRAAGGVHLVAELGKASTLHVRWQKEIAGQMRPVVRTKEMYYWDLQRTTSRLLGAIEYTITGGSVAELTVNIPKMLEIVGVDVDATRRGLLFPRLREWTIAERDNQRVLQLRFQEPVTENIQVSLELVPRILLHSPVILQVPTPLDASSAAGYLAYRILGSNARVAAFSRVTGVQPEEFSDLWQRTGMDDPGLADRAYRFQRTGPPGPGTGGPVVQLKLEPLQVRPHVRENITWLVDRTQADLQASAKVVSLAEDLLLVEWDVPKNLQVIDVRGPDIQSWSRSGTLVQVWLGHSLRETTLELDGYISLGREPTAKDFELPSIGIRSADREWAAIKVRARSGLRLQPLQVQNLWPVPDSHIADYEQTFISRHPSYSGHFRITQASAQTPSQPRKNNPAAERLVTPRLPQAFSGSEPVRLFREEQRAALTDERHWYHEALYWIYHSSGTDLSFSLPAGGQFTELTVDGRDIAPLRPDDTQVWLPLPGSATLRQVRLCWRYPSDSETFPSPRLERPRLDASETVTSVGVAGPTWIVLLPPGYTLHSHVRDAVSVSAHEFREGRDSNLKEWLSFSKEATGSSTGSFDWKGSRNNIFADGTPTYWEPASDSVTPHPQLHALAQAELYHTIMVSVLLFAGLLLSWLLSRVPFIVWLTTISRPEQAVLIGVVGGWILDSSVFFLCLAAIGVSLRLRLILRRLPTQRSEPASAS